MKYLKTYESWFGSNSKDKILYRNKNFSIGRNSTGLYYQDDEWRIIPAIIAMATLIRKKSKNLLLRRLKNIKLTEEDIIYLTRCGFSYDIDKESIAILV